MRGIGFQLLLLATLAAAPAAVHASVSARPDAPTPTSPPRASAARISSLHPGSHRRSDVEHSKRAPSRKPALPAAGYRAGYRKGYAAGRAAARRELAFSNSCPDAQRPPSSHPARKPFNASPSSLPSSTPAATALAPSAPTASSPPAFAPEAFALTALAAAAAAAAPALAPAASAPAALAHPSGSASSPNPDSPAESSAGLAPTPATLRVDLNPTASSLRGSTASLLRQNQRLAADQLERILDEDDLSARIAHKLLVPLPASAALAVNADLPAAHRFCRPWTALFLSDLARTHQAAFRRPLVVTSAVRTVDYQKQLIAINPNAAPAEGEIISPHIMGAAVDIAKDGLSPQELEWMRRHLLALEAQGKIDVEEEFEQACFHISVYRSYVPAPAVVHKAATPKNAALPSTGPSRDRTTRPTPATAATASSSASTLMAARVP